MTLGELLGGIPSEPGAELRDAELHGIELADLVMDSRQVGPGAAFVAVQGHRGHGLDHVDEAVARGAAAILYEPASGIEFSAAGVPGVGVAGLRGRLGELGRRFFASARPRQRLVGITGTNGKSTVAYLVAQAQTLRGAPCGYVGTVGAGIPPRLAPQALTTPDCLSLHRTLGALDAAFVAMEVSSHALAQDRIAGLALDTAVFTNLSRDHLDYHGDMDRYRAAKARLFAWPGLRRAVINADDPFGAELAERMADSIERIGVGLAGRGDLRGGDGPRGGDLRGRGRLRSRDDPLGPGNLRSRGNPAGGGLRGTVVAASMNGISVRVGGLPLAEVGVDEVILDSPLVGRVNAENLLLALGVLLGWEVPPGEACAALGRCRAPAGRLQVLGGGARAPWVVVDYAHTPAGLARVLADLRGLAPGELWCVFGCGGERDRGKRPLMGRAAARHADHIVLTDDNPRGEDPAAIVAAIRSGIVRAGGSARRDVRIEHDRGAAIVETVARARPGDAVLVAGKGHERRQLAAGRDRDFNDAATVRSALGALA